MITFVPTVILGLALHAASSPLLDQRDTANNSVAGGATNGTGTGRSMQVTVTGYEDCTTKAMACPILGVDSHSPTAALSALLIPEAGQGLCGSCWRITNAYTLAGFGPGKIPVKGSLDPNSQANKDNGMVVLINNSCAKDPAAPVGQCNQTPESPLDKLGSSSVLDLCTGTDAVQQFFNSPKAGMGIATATQVDCSEWKGQQRQVPW